MLLTVCLHAIHACTRATPSLHKLLDVYMCTDMHVCPAAHSKNSARLMGAGLWCAAVIQSVGCSLYAGWVLGLPCLQGPHTPLLPTATCPALFYTAETPAACIARPRGEGGGE